MFFFFRLVSLLVSDFFFSLCSQLTFQRERENRKSRESLLFLFINARREVNARRTGAISRARNAFASFGGVALSRARER